MDAAVAAIWGAIDTLTKPSRHPIQRDDGTTTHALVLSLWDQSSEALTWGEIDAGRGSKPLRERSIADLDLLEIRGLIADTTRHELALRHLDRPATVPAQVRRLAAHVTGHEPDELWWWEYRFSSWTRLLGTYLRAFERQPHKLYLRNAACPLCGKRQTVIEEDGEKMVVPALKIEFYNGYVQAAVCQACQKAWFRGAPLEELAAAVHDTPTPASCAL